MELYLDSANLKEIENAFQLGFLHGLTTTPTFMHREGVTDVDATILKLAKIVPVLQIEALGNSAEQIVDEAERLLALGLDKKKTVFKIPISLEGAKACKMLRDKDMLVNLHLIYTIQQAYIAMSAGATYACPLVGRSQDQGNDALALVKSCVDTVEKYKYPTKIMFSSVRNAEHVRNALNIGVHTFTAPWSVLKLLPQNHFTDLGTQQFVEHTRLMTVRVNEVIRENKAIIHKSKTIYDALIEMTVSKLGAITVVDDLGQIHTVFTDGDLRRQIELEGESVLRKVLGDLPARTPITIDADSLLFESSNIFKEKKIDTIVVTQNGAPVGMLDIQDLL